MSELGLVSSLGTSENRPAAVDVRAFRGGNCMCNIATHRHRLRCKRDFLYSVATNLKCQVLNSDHALRRPQAYHARLV